MRELNQPYIGRIGNEMTRDVFDCTGFKRDMGPFASEKSFDAWSLKKIKCPISRVFWEACLPSMRENKEPPRFVLTHGNLVADNIMVQDGQITGIVGWSWSAFLPEYMEYAMATAVHRKRMQDWWLPVLKRVLEPAGYFRCKYVSAACVRTLK